MKKLQLIRTIQDGTGFDGPLAAAWHTNELFALQPFPHSNTEILPLNPKRGFTSVSSPLSADYFSVSESGNFFVLATSDKFFCYRRINSTSAKLYSSGSVPGIRTITFDEGESNLVFIQETSRSLLAGKMDMKGRPINHCPIPSFNENTPFVKDGPTIKVVGANVSFTRNEIHFQHASFGSNGLKDFYLRCPDKILEIAQPTSPKGKYMIFTPDAIELSQLSNDFTKKIAPIVLGKPGYISNAITSHDSIFLVFRNFPKTIARYKQI